MGFALHETERGSILPYTYRYLVLRNLATINKNLTRKPSEEDRTHVH
jgi:hypothetical protein